MSPDRTTVGTVLDQVPIGRFHRRLLVLTGSTWAMAAMEVLLISFTLSAMRSTWGLTGTQAGILGSASLVGMVVGSWAGGTLADQRGRIVVLQSAVLLYGLATGATALSIGFFSAAALRVLTGLGIGATATVATAYLSEHLPTSRRGSYLTYFDAFWAAGTILATGVAWFFLAGYGDQLGAPVGVAGWRLLYVAGVVPIVLVPAIRSLNETPYYLLKEGNERQARRRIEMIAERNGFSLDLSDVRLEIQGSDDGMGIKRLFERDLLGRTLVISLAWFGANFGFYGVFIWLPNTIGASGIVGGLYRYLLLAGLIQVPGYLSVAYLVDRLGRKYTLGAYLLLAGVATYLFAVAATGITGAEVAAFWPFLLGLLGASFFSVGTFGALRAYTPELFPTRVRSTGSGFAEGSGRVAGILGPIVAGTLVSSGYIVALTPLAVGFGLAGIIVLVFGIKTSGRSLE